jgi:hypothetical protein
MLLGVAAFAFLLGTLLHLWPHLHWRFGWADDSFREVQRVPSAPMPAAETPDDWVRCRFGSLEFDLPPALAARFRSAGENSGLTVLEDGTRTMLLSLPEKTDEMVEYIEDSTAALPELQELSPIELRLAMYEASWDDSSWAMSRAELGKHIFLVSMGLFDRAGNPRKVETLFREDIEGLLVVRAGHAEYEWYSADARARGVIQFFQEPEEIDLSWVRPICHSLRFSGECYSNKMKGKELAELFEIVEP